MDDLIAQISERTGLPADRARTAVDTVVGYLENKLPEPVAGQLRQAISGEASGGAIGDAAKGLGEKFGIGS